MYMENEGYTLEAHFIFENLRNREFFVCSLLVKEIDLFKGLFLKNPAQKSPLKWSTIVWS